MKKTQEKILESIRQTKGHLKRICNITAKYVSLGLGIFKERPDKILGMKVIYCPDDPSDQIFLTSYVPCNNCLKNKTKLCKGWPK